MKFLDGVTVGIDLGTTYSAIARIDDEGNAVVLNNADGRPITPSVVLLDEQRVVVGPSFQRISVASPTSIIEAIKREMGNNCLLYTSPSPRDRTRSRMPSSA